MIRIKYGPNPQGIREVEIQPQLVDSLIIKNKEIKKRPEQKKVKQIPKEEAPKPIPTPPRKNKMVWKTKEAALKSTTTPPKSNKWCGSPSKYNHPLLPDQMYHQQAKTERRRVLLNGLKMLGPRRR